MGEAPRVGCNADALRLLTSNGLPCTRVVSVDRDSILYLNQLGRPRTLWLHHPAHGAMRVKMEVGFACVPPAGWHEAREGDNFNPSPEAKKK